MKARRAALRLSGEIRLTLLAIWRGGTGLYGSYDLTLASVEELTGGAETRFGLMFTASSTPPPAGVYRLTELTSCAVPDAQLFIAGSERSRRSARRHSSSITGRRP